MKTISVWMNWARPLIFFRHPGILTTESQDLGLTSHLKDGAFYSIVSRHYTGALGPTQTTG